MDDDAIVRLYWNRDETAISVTARKYGSYCLSISRNILGSREDAEECVTDAYLNLWNSIPPNRPQNLPAYLGKIVRNLSFNRYKRNRAKKRGSGQIARVLDELSEVVSNSGTPESAWDDQLLAESIRAFVSGLPENRRMLFVRRYWYAESVREIAKRFGKSENSVSVTLSRLREELRKHLTESGFEL